MSLIALGINHRTAPVDIRERVAFPEANLGAALETLGTSARVEEAVILSTCNRTEIYCELGQADPAPIIEWLGRFHDIPASELQPYLYVHCQAAAVRHALRVASGLDSMVLGEPQILGQFKQAFQHARSAGRIQTRLGRLFQHAFNVAKQVRTDTAIGESPVSVAFAAVSLARQIFGDLRGQTALMIGAGETIELASLHLRQQGLERLIIANRTFERAHALASRFSGYAIGLEEINAHLAEADIVISATGAPTAIIDRAQVQAAIRKRRHRPVFMVDIAVPRDIDARVSELDDVYLYTVDDLQEVVQENMRSRRQAADQAEEIIALQTENFLGWLRSLDAVARIRHFRARAESRRDEVLEKARGQLSQGRPAEEVLDFLAQTLTNKLIHEPTVALRQAGFDGRYELITAAEEILGLPAAQPGRGCERDKPR